MLFGQFDRAPNAFVFEASDQSRRPKLVEMIRHLSSKTRLLHKNAPSQNELHRRSLSGEPFRANDRILRQGMRGACQNISRDLVSLGPGLENSDGERRDLRFVGSLGPANQIVRFIQLQDV